MYILSRNFKLDLKLLVDPKYAGSMLALTNITHHRTGVFQVVQRSCGSSLAHDLIQASSGMGQLKKLVHTKSAYHEFCADQFSSASDVLRLYAGQQQSIQLPEAVGLLTCLRQLCPSVHDERLESLVDFVVEGKAHLPLSLLVDVSITLQSLRLHKALGGLTDLVLESASFLSSDVVMMFAKTLAMSCCQAPEHIDASSYANVFRILSEHVLESMFDSTPNRLADALLAIATFHCDPRSGAVLVPLSVPWHLDVFAECAPLLIRNVSSISPEALVKHLRAYWLLLRAERHSTPAIHGKECSLQHNAVVRLPFVIAETLATQLADIPMKSVVRSLHMLTTMHQQDLWFTERVELFCVAAVEEILVRAKEMNVRDLAFTLQALAVVVRELPCIDPPLLSVLYNEVQYHITSLTLPDSLMIARAIQGMSHLRPPGIVLELLAAEFVRELRNMQAKQLCDVITFCSRMRSEFQDTSFLEIVAHRFEKQAGDFTPRQIATCLHGLAKARLQDIHVFETGSQYVRNNLVGFTPRDLALSLWAFVTVRHDDADLFIDVQKALKKEDISDFKPVDVTMTLWSLSKSESHIDEELLGIFTHFVARNCSEFSPTALLLSCISFAQLGFAQQPVLVNLYRSLYAKLPDLSHSQLSFSFFLFSTSGVRDEALVNRFLFECERRLSQLHGQNLGNVVLACSRVAVPVRPPGDQNHVGIQLRFADRLKQHIFDELDDMRHASMLTVYIGAPLLLNFCEAENLKMMTALMRHLPVMSAEELVRCLVATSRIGLVDQQFLVAIFHYLRKRRADLEAPEVIACIWSVYTLGYCRARFRRTLGYVLAKHVRLWNLSARSLCNILPALSEYGFWERLPLSLRHSIWRLASDEMRGSASMPPPREPRQEKSDNEWTLPKVEPGMFRHPHHYRRRRFLSRQHGIELLKDDPRQERWDERADLREMATVRDRPTGVTALEDFVSIIQKL